MQTSVEIEFHQFVLGEGFSHDEPLQPTPEPLCLVFEPRVTRAAVLTGAASGRVLVEVEARDRPPTELDLSWEDVAEVSLTVLEGPLQVSGWGLGGPSTARLDAAGTGTYRIRVHARHRDTDPDGVASVPVEEFLVQAWPASHEPPVTLRATSEAAQAELRY